MFFFSFLIIFSTEAVVRVTQGEGLRLTMVKNSIFITSNPQEFYCFVANSYQDTVNDFSDWESVFPSDDSIYAVRFVTGGYLVLKPKTSVANLIYFTVNLADDIQSFDIYIYPNADFKFSVGHTEDNDLTLGLGQSNHIFLLADYYFNVQIDLKGIASEDLFRYNVGSGFQDVKEDKSITLNELHGGLFSWISSGASCSDSVSLQVTEVNSSPPKSQIHLTQENVYCAYGHENCMVPTYTQLTYKSCKLFEIHSNSEVTTIGLVLIIIICVLFLISVFVTIGCCCCSKSYSTPYIPVQDTPYTGNESINPNYLYDNQQQQQNNNQTSNNVELPQSSTTLYAPQESQNSPPKKSNVDLPGNSMALYIPESPQNQYGYPQANSTYNQQDNENPYSDIAKNPGFQPPPPPP